MGCGCGKKFTGARTNRIQNTTAVRTAPQPKVINSANVLPRSFSIPPARKTV